MGLMKKKRRAVWILVAAILTLLTFAPVRAEEKVPEAADITAECVFVKNNSEIQALYSHDGKYVTCNSYGLRDTLSVRSRSDEMGMLYFRLGTDDVQMILRQFDRQGTQILSSELHADSVCFIVPLEEDCWSVEITAKENPFDLNEMTVLGRERLPDWLPNPEPPVEQTDFLIITTHPDDEWIFLGGVYPIYGAERGYTGTFAYITTPSAGRVHEAINSVWSAGVKTMPYFLGLQDIPASASTRAKMSFKEDAALALARLYRQIKPLVVVTQDPVNGEYGHWQHIVSAEAALEAVALAENPAFDPESAEQYGTWSVRKVYQHMAEDGRILLNIDEPLAAYGGMTAFEVAERAFAEHQSQQQYSYRPSKKTEGYYDMRRFGLTYTAVGPDTGSDMFENIAQDELAGTVLADLSDLTP